MSIDMYLGPSKTQGSTTTSVCNNYQSGLTGLQEAISNFTADQVLRSLAYDSAKGYFQEAYVPLIQGAILVVEVTAKAVEKLPTDYVAQVDSCDLKSSELEREIQQYEVQIQGMQEQIEQVKELLPVSSERVQHIREANGLISDYTNAKAKLEKQLQKLLAFHAFSTMIFVEVTSLKNAIDQGLAQVSGGKGFNAQKGTFSNGNLKDRSWMDTIGKKWQEREKERLKDQMPNMDGLEYKQIDFNGGKVWCWVKEGHTTADPEDIEKTFLYNDWVARMLKKYGSDYFTPEREPGVMDLLVEQNLRLFEELRTGIDSKTGKKLTPLERLARGTSLANSLAALGVGAKQITNVGRGKSSQSPTKSPIINRGPRVNDIGKSNKTITVPGKKIQSVKGKPSKVKAPGKASGANSPKTDFGAENPVSGKDWNNYFKNKYGAGNVHWKNPVSSISELMDTPGSLINVNPADVTDFVKREGWTVTPLKKGGSAGIPYEEGGGFSMNPPKGTSGDSRYIQYHPGNGHHGEVPYYKISQPNKPTVRIYMDGRYEID